MPDTYQPTVHALREAWRRDRVWAFGAPAVAQRGAAEAGFDEWLDEHDRQIKAEAWDEGYGDDWDASAPRTNPYRIEATDV